MNKNQLSYTIFMMLAITVIGLLLNFFVLLPAYSSQALFSAKDIKSIAVDSNGRPYYLNCKEQKSFLATLELAECSEKFDTKHEYVATPLLTIKKLVIYRFDHPPIELIPLGEIDGKMLFHVVGLEHICYIIENKPKELESLLSSIQARGTDH